MQNRNHRWARMGTDIKAKKSILEVQSDSLKGDPSFSSKLPRKLRIHPCPSVSSVVKVLNSYDFGENGQFGSVAALQFQT